VNGPGVQAYSSTVTSPGLIVAGGVIGVAVAASTLAIAPRSPVGPLGGVAVVLTTIFVATVRLAVGPHHIVLGQGPSGWPRRVVPISLLADAYADDLTRAQEFGLGVGWHRLTTRMTVRPGPTLVLTLTTGELIRISTCDPDAALAVIHHWWSGRRPAPRQKDTP
jgi:hypothetical protein